MVKPIVIKREHLSRETELAVQRVLKARKERLMKLAPVGAITGLASTAAYLPDRPVANFLKAMAGATVLAAGALTLPNANRRVVKETKLAAQTARNYYPVAPEHSDVYNVPPMNQLRATHPLMAVDPKGNVHFIPKSKFQAVLASAQETRLKHIIPARKRETY